MPNDYIVNVSAMLGPPNTQRVFFRGEHVTKEDFTACLHLWDRLHETRSLRRASEEEIPAAKELRAANTRSDLGLPENASDEAIADAVKQHRESALAAEKARLEANATQEHQLGMRRGIVPPMPAPPPAAPPAEAINVQPGSKAASR